MFAGSQGTLGLLGGPPPLRLTAKPNPPAGEDSQPGSPSSDEEGNSAVYCDPSHSHAASHWSSSLLQNLFKPTALPRGSSMVFLATSVLRLCTNHLANFVPSNSAMHGCKVHRSEIHSPLLFCCCTSNIWVGMMHHLVACTAWALLLRPLSTSAGQCGSGPDLIPGIPGVPCVSVTLPAGGRNQRFSTQDDEYAGREVKIQGSSRKMTSMLELKGSLCAGSAVPLRSCLSGHVCPALGKCHLTAL